MLSPQLRSEIDKLWSDFWSAGMTNPLTSVEQITYLLFLKRLEDQDKKREAQGKPSLYGPRPSCDLQHHEDDYPEGESAETVEGCPGHPTCKWSYITHALTSDNPHDLFTQHVFPWLRELDVIIKEKSGNGENGLAHTAERMADAYFQLPRDKVATLKKAIGTINRLFTHVDAQGASGDVMGDLFEYLLSEIQTSGKNGQFRTPRHLIRFMIELLDPKPGDRICDPAAGTGGFLVNSVLHLRKKDTDPEILRLEWDGTPRRAVGSVDTDEHIANTSFVGYDNDRTMVRIGWMNMILHGIEDPDFDRRDTLSKAFEDEEQFNLILANPPFTGNVDEDDLNPKRPWKSGKKAATTKSELLFVWLILDLLETGGRAAVIVPEGVLFGSTKAHVKLRQQLLLDNRLEGVISLPANVFQPYTSVKTSILIFQKVGRRKGESPKTDEVWFYEVEADGFTLDAKRDRKPEPNDLWDALEKWHAGKPMESLDYYRPELWRERWRMVDHQTRNQFGERVAQYDDGVTVAVQEIFPSLAPPSGHAEPSAFEPAVKEQLRERTLELYRDYLRAGLPEAARKAADKNTEAQQRNAAEGELQGRVKQVAGWFRSQAKNLLDQDHEQHANKALREVLGEVSDDVQENVQGLATEALDIKPKSLGALFDEEKPSGREGDDLIDMGSRVDGIVEVAAQLDGYNILLRSLEVHREEATLEDSKCWTAPVRRFMNTPGWESVDGTLKGSHDEDGTLRPEFLKDRRIYDGDRVKEEYLDPDCLEANDYNLTAGRYKPFKLTTKDYDPPADIIRDLQMMEKGILKGLGDLLKMVEGEA